MPSLPLPACSDRGFSESLQWTLLTPVVVLLVLGAIEAGLVVQARNAVAQAALAGAEAGAVASGNVTAAQQAATTVASQGGLDAVTVATQQGPASISVSVTAHVSLPIDLGLGAVTATAVMPRER